MKNYLSSVLFALLASFSFAVSAVDTANAEAGEATSEQVAQAVTVNLNTADAETLQRVSWRVSVQPKLRQSWPIVRLMAVLRLVTNLARSRVLVRRL